MDKAVGGEAEHGGDDGGAVRVRPLEKQDYERGFVALLGQLTSVGAVTRVDFLRRFNEMFGCGGHSSPYRTLVAHDVHADRLVGTATLFVERKFIHSRGSLGHIEDVVVDEQRRGERIGKRLVRALIDMARTHFGCYKVVLSCAEHNVPFYERIGMQRREAQMALYLDQSSAAGGGDGDGKRRAAP